MLADSNKSADGLWKARAILLLQVSISPPADFSSGAASGFGAAGFPPAFLAGFFAALAFFAGISVSYTEDRFNIGSPRSMPLSHEGHKAFLELAGAERDEAWGRVHGHPQRRRDVELHMPPLHLQAHRLQTHTEGEGGALGTQGSAPRASYVENPMVREKALEDREYQRRMVKRAPQANTLVVLPTALGKTIIAELVAAESDKLLTPNVTSGC
jgi:hypothetical protein